MLVSDRHAITVLPSLVNQTKETTTMTNTLTVKGASEEVPFNVLVPIPELVEFVREAAIAAENELDIENAKSPGGFATALFTALLPAKARAAVNWNLAKDGWNSDKAKAAFAFRLERKSRKLTDEEKTEKAAKALATRQADYDTRADLLAKAGLDAATIAAAIGTRPVAKA